MTSIEQTEDVRFELQKELATAKTRIERNRLGQFATPPALASEIITYALSLLPLNSKIRFLEPGFGTGPFYSALLHHESQTRIQAAVGYEIDPHYAEAARKLWLETGLQLHTDDFTQAKSPETEAEKFNLVACNPPYVRHHHLSEAQKHVLQATVARRFNLELNGLSGLYIYFMLLSCAWMRRDGVGAWLVPSEFMSVNYGRQLKQFLLERVTSHRIHRFDPNEIQFGDALVSSAAVFFSNTPPPGDHKVEFTFGGALLSPKESDSITLDDLQHIPKWTNLPQSLTRRPRHLNGKTLSDLFTIKRGLATGCNSFFILTPKQADQFSLPKEFLQPILPSPRELGTDEIFADENGEPKIESRRYLLICNLRENEVKSKYPMLWQYLDQGIKKEIHQRYLSRHRQPWYSQENRLPAPFLCTYMGRPTKHSNSPFRFIINYSKATAPNVYLMLYPKPPLTALLKESPDLFKAVWQALSSITVEILTGEGRVYGGGLYKLEPKELANVAADNVLNALPDQAGAGWQKQLALLAL